MRSLRFALLSVMVFGFGAIPSAAQSRTVLAIHWGTEEFPVTPMVNAAIRDALTSDRDTVVDYFSEYLETDTLPPPQAADALAVYIQTKFRDRQIDLVMAVADPALAFVLDHRDDLFADVPIVYSGVAHPDQFQGHVPDRTAAVLRGAAYVETLRLALDLQPSTDHVFVVSGLATADAVKQALGEFARRVSFTFLDNAMPMADVLRVIRAAPPKSLVLFIAYPQPDAGRVATDLELVRLIAEASPVPVYGTNELYIGRGVVGGTVRSGVATAKRMASMALEILHGRRAGDIPIENAQLTPIFDGRQLARHRIDRSRLPAGSEIRFPISSSWESIRGYVIGSAVIFTLQLALIGTLWQQWARRRRAEGLIRAREATLRVSFDRIRRLTGRLIHAQESTRAAIARDLHDDVCQELVAVAIGVTSLKASSPELPPPLHGELSQLQERTLDIVDRVRRLSHDLHPVTLRLLGLTAALRAHCIEVEKRYDVQVALHAADNAAAIPAETALGLFRIAQEALRNGAVHGEARRLDVTLARGGDQIELIVTDDGRGFDPEAARRDGSGLGLVSIEERAHLARGTVSITSRLWHGTTIRVRVPTHNGVATEDVGPSSLVHVHSVAVKS